MIKELENEFIGVGEVKGFKFRKIQSTQYAYTYEVLQNGVMYYETFKRLKSPVCIDFEKRIYSDTDFKEFYPKANRFGVDAFTFKNEIDAVNKMIEIDNAENFKYMEGE